MILYIIRHGETMWNKAGRMQGKTDISLSKDGRKLAQKTAEGLKNVKFDYIFSSPLERAYETACIIRGSRDTEVVKDERLIEIGFGRYEGTVVEERKGSIARFFDDPENYVAEKNAESYESLLTRTKEFLEDVLFPIEEKEPDATILISGHGALNKALFLHLLDKQLKDFWSGVYQGNCAVNKFEIKNGNVRLIEEAKYYY